MCWEHERTERVQNWEDFEIALEDQGIPDSETEGCKQIREMQASLGENREPYSSHLLLLVVMKRKSG
jgi:hypothetical protein